MGSTKRYKYNKGNKRRFFRGTAKKTDVNNEEHRLNEDAVVNQETAPPKSGSASEQKIDLPNAPQEHSNEPETTPECNFLMNSDLFLSLTLVIARCPACVAAVNIIHLPLRMGLAHFFELSCTECEWKMKFCSSKECGRISDSSGRNCYEVNKRSIIAFRENGLGFTGLSTFCRCMNMPPPMAQTTFDDLNSDLHNAYVQTAQESMAKAGKAVYEQSTDMDGLLRNTSVSGDGAWQKRGYSSLNGVMTLISGGKCVDVEVLSKKCKRCEHWERKKETDEYLEWKETHECSINHVLLFTYCTLFFH